MTEPILLTPGPLTTSTETKTAMLSDWGSWDGAFNAMTASVCRDFLAILHAHTPHLSVPLQPSDTFPLQPPTATRRGLEVSANNPPSLVLDFLDQWQCLQKAGQGRFTPPTHVLAALRAALDQFLAQGGQPARLARYAENCRALVSGMRALGLETFLPDALQAPIIVTFHAPPDPKYDFAEFYRRGWERGFFFFPRKITPVETFPVGCIRALPPPPLRAAVSPRPHPLPPT